MVTLKDALTKGTMILKKADIETPAVDAGVLLCHSVGCDRTYLYAHGDKQVDDRTNEIYTAYLNMRARGMPVQYITGHCEFMALDFIIGSDVLIPRPDTEILVETAVRMLKGTGLASKVLDIGTGSGCIAVSMAHLLKSCVVTATDISAAALAIARQNAEKNGVSGRIEFIRGNLYESLGCCRFDAILSNPPYIRSEDIGWLQKEVRDFEPHQALDGGPDGIYFYRRIIEGSPNHLNEQGLLIFEVGYDQAPEVASLMDCLYRDIEIFKDLSGIDRIITGKLKEK